MSVGAVEKMSSCLNEMHNNQLDNMVKEVYGKFYKKPECCKINMAKQAKTIVEGPSIEGLGKLVSTLCPADDAINNLAKHGAEPISARDYAFFLNAVQFARPMAPFRDSSLNSGFIREAVVTIPNGPTLLVADSPIFKNIKKVIQDLREYAKDGEECVDFGAHIARSTRFSYGPTMYVNREEFMALAEQESVKGILERKIHILSPSVEKILKNEETYVIPANRFGDDEVTLWAFKDQAKLHGEKLKTMRVDAIFFGAWTRYTIEENSNWEINLPFARQMWYSPIERQFNTYEAINDKLIHRDGNILGLRKEEVK
jgi:hypothetical protein